MDQRNLWGELLLSAAYRDSLSSDKSTSKTREKTREQILRLIGSNPAISAPDLAQRIGITAKGIEWLIGKLEADGRIRRAGRDKVGHCEIVEAPDA